MFERLENRVLFQTTFTPLTINGTSSGDTIVITQSGNTLTVTNNNVTTTHALSGVTPGGPTPNSPGSPWAISKIVVNGLGGNDSIQANYTVMKRLEMFGGPGSDTVRGGGADDLLCGGSSKTALETGNDSVRGGNGNDEIHASMYGGCTLLGENGDDNLTGYWGADSIDGGAGADTVNAGGGNDTTIGGAGNDHLHGEDGNDAIHGNAGTDWLFGQAGDDRIYGGADADFSFGGSGDDVIVSIGGAQNDNNYGEGGRDSFWVDSESTEYTDATSTEKNAGCEHRVDKFYTNNCVYGFFPIGQETPSRNLNGQELMDPLSKVPGYAKTDFGGNKLFASNGPTKNDIDQNAAADCYFLSALAAIAKVKPGHIREMVTDLGDGTFAVRFKNASNQDEFVRVDGDLYTSGGTPVYAGLGRQDSAWVAIVEKAWCFYRQGLGTYTSIEYWEPSNVLHKVYQSLGVTDQQIVIANVTKASMLQSIKDGLASGKGVVISGPGSLNAMTPMDSTTLHSAQHAFLVDSVSADNKFITLRNPYATQGPAGDGYVTISVDQAWYCGYDLRILTVP